MRQATAGRIEKALRHGLRRFSNNPRGTPGLMECHNMAPAEQGLEPHEEILDLAGSEEWGGEGQKAASSETRDVTIRVRDYLTLDDVSAVTVIIDGNTEGVTDSNGELLVTGLPVGGHTLRLTHADNADSDTDDLLNDYIMVV